MQRFTVEKRKIPDRVPEWRLQAAIISEFHRLQDLGWPFVCAGDMNAGTRNPAMAKVTGITAGEPDIRVYLPRGRLGMIEVKAKRGTLSPAQKARHSALAALGHDVAVVQVGTPQEAQSAATGLLRAWLGDDLQMAVGRKVADQDYAALARMSDDPQVIIGRKVMDRRRDALRQLSDVTTEEPIVKQRFSTVVAQMRGKSGKLKGDTN